MSTPGGSEADKSKVISALVQQLKNGEINKSELFDRLSKLSAPRSAARGAAPGSSDAAGAERAPETGDDAPAGSADGAGGSAGLGSGGSPERREKVARLIEQKRAARSAASSAKRAPPAASPAGAGGDADRELDMDQFRALHDEDGGARGQTPRTGRRRGPQQQQRAPSPAGARGGAGSRSAGRRGRSGRAAAPATEDYTFKPKITKLPSSYHKRAGDDLPFEQRVMLWKQLKDEEYKRRRAAEEEEAVKDCTFKPKINKTSRVTAARKRAGGKSVHSRLYEQGSPRGVATRGGGRPAGLDEDDARECTFRPKINQYSSSAREVKPRYMDEPKRRAPTDAPPDMEECTFKPKTLNPKPSMHLAQEYLKTDVVERLSRQRSADDSGADLSGSGGDLDVSRRSTAERAGGHGGTGGGGGSSVRDGTRPVMDMNTFLNSMEGRAVYTPPKSRGAPKGRRPQSAGSAGQRGRRGRRGSTGSGSTRGVSPSFQQFLERQNMRQQKKEEHLDDIKKSMNRDCTFQPKLDKNSLDMAQKNMGDKFLHRLAAHMLRKEHEAVRQKARVAHDPECTFQPKILKASQKRSARTAVEMSRGDALKRETAQRLMRLQAEQAELAGLTFQPETNTNKRKWEGVDGRLRILEDPDGYLERVQKEQKAFSERQRRAMQEAEMKEFSECTFKPQVHDAPAYVKRIARSWALTRAAQGDESTEEKPEWR